MRKVQKILSLILVMSILLCGCGSPSLPLPVPDSVSAVHERATGSDTSSMEQEAPSNTPQSPSETTPPPIDIAPDSTFSVRYLDVGQADAALVECDGHYMLIDGGNKADSNLLYSVLSNSGITYLDIVVGTHAHEDHIGGLPGALSFASAGLTLCPVTTYDSDSFSDFSRYAQEKGNGIVVPSVGDVYSLGSATVTILGLNAGEEPNNTSIILKVQYGETSFLFTGDAEREAEQALLDSGADLSATVLKAGHHGSSTSSSYPFLREVMPQITVISVGADNSYGHPAENTLSRFRDCGTEVYRTDCQGDVTVVSDGRTVSVSTSKNSSSEALLSPGDAAHSLYTPEIGLDIPDTDLDGITYIANIHTGKFHIPSCESVESMNEDNKLYVNLPRLKSRASL